MTYTIGNILSKGGHGTIHQVMVEKHPLPLVAKKMTNYIGLTISSIRELVFGQVISHPNLISPQDIIIDEIDVYALYPKGTPLFEYLNNSNLSYSERKSIFNQILSGVNYLHQNGIIHGDISGENIVMIDNIPKIIDMGSAFIRDYPESKLVGPKHQYKIPKWRSTISANDPEFEDMWSLGILLYLIMTGEYLDVDSIELIDIQLQYANSKGVSDDIVRTIHHLLLDESHTENDINLNPKKSKDLPTKVSVIFFDKLRNSNLIIGTDVSNFNSLISARKLKTMSDQIFYCLIWISVCVYTRDGFPLSNHLSNW